MFNPEQRLPVAVNGKEMFAGLAVILAGTSLLAVLNRLSAQTVRTLMSPFFLA